MQRGGHNGISKNAATMGNNGVWRTELNVDEKEQS